MPPLKRTLSVLGAAAATMLGTVAAGDAQANPGRDARDPVYVYYPNGSCREGAMEVELWDRSARTWTPHPLHPVIAVESCQLEDAGRLLHEIRWRCLEQEPAPLPPAWVVGLEVFNPSVMEHCAGAGRVRAQGGADIVISSPRPGEQLRGENSEVAIEGHVRIAGLEGASYDVVIALDVSRRVGANSGGVDLLGAEVAAARSFIESKKNRLGDVRIGLVTFPNRQLSRDDPGGTGARRDASIGTSLPQLDRALRNVIARGSGSFQSFSSGLDFALAELAGANPGSTARPAARKVLVIAADGRGDLPFGSGARDAPEFQRRFEAAVKRARDLDIEVHFFALSGVAGEAPEFVDVLTDHARTSFHRVAQPQLGASFLEIVSLPYVRQVEVVDLRNGEQLRHVSADRDGQFSATFSAEGGPNPLLITGITSEGQRIEREFVLDFDDSLVRERLRAAERERIRRVRERLGHVHIEAVD